MMPQRTKAGFKKIYIVCTCKNLFRQHKMTQNQDFSLVYILHLIDESYWKNTGIFEGYT